MLQDNINVVVRIRDSDGPKYWKKVNNIISSDKENFEFDRIYDYDSRTISIYEEKVKPVVLSAMNGFNGSVLAYGQTSSGKTYTMLGTDKENGIIKNCLNDIFSTVEQSANCIFLIRMQYIEIYNEKILDLFKAANISSDCAKNENYDSELLINTRESDRRKFVEIIVKRPQDCIEYLAIAEKSRHFSSTSMNERSSRSHTILRVLIENSDQSNDDTKEKCKSSWLDLVDLAGSERQSSTNTAGQALTEACYINSSLSTLCRVIRDLSKKKDNVFISYRDSKLTTLLKESLGGNSKCTIICMVRPDMYNETRSTLQFAQNAKNVKNTPIVNTLNSEIALLGKSQKEISLLQNELEQTRFNLKKMEEMKESKESEVNQLRLRLEEYEMNIHSIENRFCFSSKLTSPSVNIKNLTKRRMTWCPGKGNLISRPMNDFPSVTEEFENSIYDKENFDPNKRRSSQKVDEPLALKETLNSELEALRLENKNLRSQLIELEIENKYFQDSQRDLEKENLAKLIFTERNLRIMIENNDLPNIRENESLNFDDNEYNWNSNYFDLQEIDFHKLYEEIVYLKEELDIFKTNFRKLFEEINFPIDVNFLEKVSVQDFSSETLISAILKLKNYIDDLRLNIDNKFGQSTPLNINKRFSIELCNTDNFSFILCDNEIIVETLNNYNEFVYILPDDVIEIENFVDENDENIHMNLNKNCMSSLIKLKDSFQLLKSDSCYQLQHVDNMFDQFKTAITQYNRDYNHKISGNIQNGKLCKDNEIIILQSSLTDLINDLFPIVTCLNDKQCIQLDQFQSFSDFLKINVQDLKKQLLQSFDKLEEQSYINSDNENQLLVINAKLKSTENELDLFKNGLLTIINETLNLDQQIENYIDFTPNFLLDKLIAKIRNDANEFQAFFQLVTSNDDKVILLNKSFQDLLKHLDEIKKFKVEALLFKESILEIILKDFSIVFEDVICDLSYADDCNFDRLTSTLKSNIHRLIDETMRFKVLATNDNLTKTDCLPHKNEIFLNVKSPNSIFTQTDIDIDSQNKLEEELILWIEIQKLMADKYDLFENMSPEFPKINYQERLVKILSFISKLIDDNMKLEGKILSSKDDKSLSNETRQDASLGLEDETTVCYSYDLSNDFILDEHSVINISGLFNDDNQLLQKFKLLQSETTNLKNELVIRDQKINDILVEFQNKWELQEACICNNNLLINKLSSENDSFIHQIDEFKFHINKLQDEIVDYIIQIEKLSADNTILNEMTIATSEYKSEIENLTYKNLNLKNELNDCKDTLQSKLLVLQEDIDNKAEIIKQCNLANALLKTQNEEFTSSTLQTESELSSKLESAQKCANELQILNNKLTVDITEYREQITNLQIDKQNLKTQLQLEEENLVARILEIKDMAFQHVDAIVKENEDKHLKKYNNLESLHKNQISCLEAEFEEEKQLLIAELKELKDKMQCSAELDKIDALNEHVRSQEQEIENLKMLSIKKKKVPTATLR